MSTYYANFYGTSVPVIQEGLGVIQRRKNTPGRVAIPASVVGGSMLLKPSQNAGGEGKQFNPGFIVNMQAGWDDDDGTDIHSTRRHPWHELDACVEFMSQYFECYGLALSGYARGLGEAARADGAVIHDPDDPWYDPHNVTAMYVATIAKRNKLVRKHVEAKFDYAQEAIFLAVLATAETCAKRIFATVLQQEIQGPVAQALSAWHMSTVHPYRTRSEIDPTDLRNETTTEMQARSPSAQTPVGRRLLDQAVTSADKVFDCFQDVALEMGLEAAVGATLRKRQVMALASKISPKLAARITHPALTAAILSQTVLQSQKCRDAEGYIHQATRRELAGALRRAGFESGADVIEFTSDAARILKDGAYSVSDAIDWMEKTGVALIHGDLEDIPEADFIEDIADTPGTVWQLLTEGELEPEDQPIPLPAPDAGERTEEEVSDE
jgi:hypothetical protein